MSLATPATIIRSVTTFYDIDKANAHLPEVRGILEHLRDQRIELIELRDQLLSVRRAEVPGGGPASPVLRDQPLPEPPPDVAPDAPPGDDTDGVGIDLQSPRILEARMRAVVDQMEAAVARLVDLSVQLRDIESGLIDFPALVAGRPVWLCWQLGEDEEIHFWHELHAGYGGRRPLIELT